MRFARAFHWQFFFFLIIFSYSLRTLRAAVCRVVSLPTLAQGCWHAGGLSSPWWVHKNEALRFPAASADHPARNRHPAGKQWHRILPAIEPLDPHNLPDDQLESPNWPDSQAIAASKWICLFRLPWQVPLLRQNRPEIHVRYANDRFQWILVWYFPSQDNHLWNLSEAYLCFKTWWSKFNPNASSLPLGSNYWSINGIFQHPGHVLPVLLLILRSVMLGQRAERGGLLTKRNE